jgi:hypothetical protein
VAHEEIVDIGPGVSISIPAWHAFSISLRWSRASYCYLRNDAAMARRE